MAKPYNRDEQVAKMKFATVYPYYVAKVEKKDRTVQELHQVIEWLTGFSKKDCDKLIKDDVTFQEFFKRAKLNKNAKKITGVVCGHRVEEIENPLTRKARYLDKLIDELAKGKAMEKIFRE